jgi:hypothetical protein
LHAVVAKLLIDVVKFPIVMKLPTAIANFHSVVAKLPATEVKFPRDVLSEVSL